MRKRLYLHPLFILATAVFSFILYYVKDIQTALAYMAFCVMLQYGLDYKEKCDAVHAKGEQ